MSQVSRPVQVLLAVTLLFAALWFVALRPKSNSATESAATPAQTTDAGSGAAPGVQGLKHAVDDAHGAVATADGDAQRAAQSSAGASGAAAAPAGQATQASRPATDAATGAPARSGTEQRAAAHRSAASARAHARHAAAVHRAKARAAAQIREVHAALRRHKAVAIAFVDPTTADARAVAREMSHVSHFRGRALAVTAPVTQLSDYPFITNGVQVTTAPTVVIVDRSGQATTIVGYADRGEIQQRLADALAVKK